MDRGIRVMHVDDEPSITELTGAMFARGDDSEPITVETATSAEEGLDRLAVTDIDCIISDYDMPGMDGIGFLQAVREDHPDLPFILFTGKGSEEVASEAVEADVSGYLQKGGTDIYELLESRVRDEVADYRMSSSYREYRTIIEALTDPVYVLDENGRFTDVNDAFLELTGYDESDIIGSPASMIKSADMVERSETHLGRILSDDHPDDALFEVEIRTADGETVPCEDHMGVIPFQGDSFRGSVGVLRDISDRQESERYRQELYEVEASTDLAFEEQCRELLQLGCERLGVEEGELVRTNPETDSREPVVVAHDTSREGKTVNLSQTYCRRVVETGALIAIHDTTTPEWRDDPASKEFDYACYIGTEVDVGDEQFGTVCFLGPDSRRRFTDAELTFVELIGRAIGRLVERQRSREDLERREHTLRRLHDVMSDQESTREERIRGLLDLSRETLGTDYAAVSRIRNDRYHVELLSAIDDAVSEGDELPLSVTACEETVAQHETQALARLGDDDRFRDHPTYTDLGYECYIGTPLYVDSEVYGTLCFLDKTARERPFSDWETALVELASRWIGYELDERANREALKRERDRLEEFASVVSHDLRSPLSVAEGRLDLAREECDSVHLDAIDRAHERMSTLIDDLLTLAREGQAVRDLEPVDLGEMTEHCWGNVTTAEANLATDVRRSIDADRSRLQQLIENLLRNAVEHGGRDVTITIGETPDGFYVEDDGPGIPEDDRDDVFNTGYTTTEEGTGFGLSIVEQVAQAHGWDVRVMEGSTGGARFEITGVEFNAT